MFAGRIKVNENISLTTGESVLIEDELPVFNALETSDIVLFITQTNAAHFDGGIYTGIKICDKVKIIAARFIQNSDLIQVSPLSASQLYIVVINKH